MTSGDDDDDGGGDDGDDYDDDDHHHHGDDDVEIKAGLSTGTRHFSLYFLQLIRHTF